MQTLYPTFEFFDEYSEDNKKIKRQCKICGDIKFVSMRHLDGKHGCSVCSAKEKAQKLRKTHEKFVDIIHKLSPNIEILSAYETNQSEIKCLCKDDGYAWETKAHILLGGHGCPKCGWEKNGLKRRTHEEFVQEMKEKHPDINILSTFTKLQSDVSFECKICGYKWDAYPSTLLKDGSGCPKCSGHAIVTESELIERLAVKNPYVEYVSGYTRMTNKALFRCKKCGIEWDSYVSNVIQGRSCSRCKGSSGEKRIAEFLDENKISYIQQYKFNDCVDVRPLPFDFYIPSCNTVIEYDGEQHFFPVVFGSTKSCAEEQFEKVKLHDNIKTKYCNEKGVNLVRIPYTEYNQIEKILDELLP